MTTERHTSFLLQNRAAYTDGWNAADAWNAGDDDAPTCPPQGWSPERRAAWNRGFADYETSIDCDPDIA